MSVEGFFFADAKREVTNKPAATESLGGNSLKSPPAEVPSESSVSTDLKDTSRKPEDTIPRRKHRKKWRKQKGKPKRPLSAYNLYFKAERARMLKRRIKKKLGFQEMAKLIGAKWHKLAPGSRSRYEKSAEKEREKYFVLLAAWKRDQLIKSSQQDLEEEEISEQEMENICEILSEGYAATGSQQETPMQEQPPTKGEELARQGMADVPTPLSSTGGDLSSYGSDIPCNNKGGAIAKGFREDTDLSDGLLRSSMFGVEATGTQELPPFASIQSVTPSPVMKDATATFDAGANKAKEGTPAKRIRDKTDLTEDGLFDMLESVEGSGANGQPLPFYTSQTMSPSPVMKDTTHSVASYPRRLSYGNTSDFLAANLREATRLTNDLLEHLETSHSEEETIQGCSTESGGPFSISPDPIRTPSSLDTSTSLQNPAMQRILNSFQGLDSSIESDFLDFMTTLDFNGTSSRKRKTTS